MVGNTAPTAPFVLDFGKKKGEPVGKPWIEYLGHIDTEACP